jgi:hypothetical protein
MTEEELRNRRLSRFEHPTETRCFLTNRLARSTAIETRTEEPKVVPTPTPKEKQKAFYSKKQEQLATLSSKEQNENSNQETKPKATPPPSQPKVLTEEQEKHNIISNIFEAQLVPATSLTVFFLIS